MCFIQVMRLIATGAQVHMMEVREAGEGGEIGILVEAFLIIEAAEDRQDSGVDNGANVCY